MGIDINISLKDVSDPDNFAKEIQHLCQNTNVSVIWNQITESPGQSFDMQFGIMGSVPIFQAGPGVNMVQVLPAHFLLRHFGHPLPPLVYRHATAAHKGN